MKHPTIVVSDDFLEKKTIINITADASWGTVEEMRIHMDKVIARMMSMPENWWDEEVSCALNVIER